MTGKSQVEATIQGLKGALIEDFQYAGQEATVRTRHGTTDWFQIGNGICQSYIYCHPAYLTYMQSTSCEMLGWMKHKLELRLQGEISVNSDTQMTPPLWQKAKRN